MIEIFTAPTRMPPFTTGVYPLALPAEGDAAPYGRRRRIRPVGIGSPGVDPCPSSHCGGGGSGLS
jgi:hypothetical protein